MTLIPEVRDELYATATRLANQPPGRRMLRALTGRVRLRPFPFGTLGLAASVACVVAVAGLSLALGDHHAGTTTTGQTNPQRSSSASVAALRSELAVLRRPQTAQDRTLPRWAQFRGIVPSTVRLARTADTPTGPIRIYVCIAQLARDRRAGKRSYRIMTIWVGDQRGHLGGRSVSGRLLAGPGNAAGGISTGPRGYSASLDPDAGVTVSVVPDDVTRVTWVFSGAGLGIEHPHHVSINVPVADNVAVLPITPGQGPLIQAAWYGAGGQRIATAADPQGRQRFAAITAFNASGHNAVAPVLRRHFALFRSTAPATTAELSRIVSDARGSFGGAKLNWPQTRYVSTVSGLDGRGLWITPGSNGLAINDPQAGGSNTIGRGLQNYGFLGVSTSNGHQTTLSGLVPDGNHTITLVLANGTKHTVPVVDHNVFETTVPGRVVAIIDRGIDGRTAQHDLR